mmetsp:Transcript_19302/g.27153  ORF Transcript_19302/g.27153 Transcript_19302/m.27153 type:complete len:239 (+) Transcript_19302:29-745(+)|eukprot:CAMPEP_0184862734 /NCGR_PEP_ID=MMETSP0580-20130426/7480_1 /TAXON_ID=1118495 /ORGANISM="Dactyliosolen fragilissimus" /LENGTH=238 /DNA_ID=CAMNT_0027360711 /DNA_START=13 /DNA_END=729 /DNA_ORIENTATION=+
MRFEQIFLALGVFCVTVNMSSMALSATTKVETSRPYLVDTKAAYRESTFPIAPEDLIERAKEILSPEIGIGTKDGGECLADDFEFCAAVVGPIPKSEYLDALKSFSLEDSFDISQNSFGFHVDPMQTNRVWFVNRQVAKQTGSFMGVTPEKNEENDPLVLPPQMLHFDFNDDGKLKEFGFYTVDRRQGNTGGLGGAFGYFYGVGRPLPIPECQPYTPSFRFRALNFIGRLGKLFKKSE